MVIREERRPTTRHTGVTVMARAGPKAGASINTTCKTMNSLKFEFATSTRIVFGVGALNHAAPREC